MSGRDGQDRDLFHAIRPRRRKDEGGPPALAGLAWSSIGAALSVLLSVYVLLAGARLFPTWLAGLVGMIFGGLALGGILIAVRFAVRFAEALRVGRALREGRADETKG